MKSTNLAKALLLYKQHGLWNISWNLIPVTSLTELQIKAVRMQYMGSPLFTDYWFVIFVQVIRSIKPLFSLIFKSAQLKHSDYVKQHQHLLFPSHISEFTTQRKCSKHQNREQLRHQFPFAHLVRTLYTFLRRTYTRIRCCVLAEIRGIFSIKRKEKMTKTKAVK